MSLNKLNNNGNGNVQKPNFKPRLWIFLQSNPITFILIALNFSIFLAMCGSGLSVMEPTSADILTWGGNLRSYTLGGDWWRLVTNLFVHFGLVHFALNIIILFELGIFLEKTIGRWAYLFTYFATGIVASLVSIWWNGEIISAGASGPIFGLFGTLIVLLIGNSLIDKSKLQRQFTIIGLAIIVDLGFSLYKKIDNPAIVGGFISGVSFGCLLYWFLSLRKNKLIFSAIVLVISVGMAGLFLHLHGDDTKAFQKAIGLVSNQEQKALAVQKKLKSQNPAQALAQIDTIMLPAWKKGKQIIVEANRLRLNPRQQKVRQELSAYLDLQLKQTTLIGQYFRGDSLTVKLQLPVVKHQIDSVLKTMNQTLSQ